MSQISIITVSYNNIKGLKKTIKNVNKQTISDFQHIIIDGNSNDGTLDFLKGQPYNSNFISEPDKGIYDAMNKGIRLAKGKWVIFMNAGDVFHNNNILEQFLEKQFQNEIIYGNCEIHYDSGFQRERTVKPLDMMWKGMSFSHQTVFIKNSLLQNNLFDLKYKFCSDFDQIFKLYMNGINFAYWKTKIAKIEAGGVSDNKRYVATNEVYSINKRLDPKIKNHIYFIPKIIYGYLIVKIKSILPKNITKQILNLKYK